MSSEVEGIVERVINEKLGRFLEEHPREAEQIIEKAVLAARARRGPQGARDGAAQGRAGLIVAAV